MKNDATASIIIIGIDTLILLSSRVIVFQLDKNTS